MRRSGLLVVPLCASALLAAALPATAAQGPGGLAQHARAVQSPALSRAAAGLAHAATGRVRLGVVLASPAAADDVARVAQGAGAGLAHRLDAVRYLSLDVPGAAAEHVRAALAHRQDVRSVEVVPTRVAEVVPDDPYYGSEQTALEAVAAPAAWDVTHGSLATKVAVIDTGVDTSHPDLAGKVVAVHNAMATAPSPTDVTDDAGHGTHVAGIVGAATGNGTGVSAFGYDTGVMAVKAGDDTGFTDDDIAAGILWSVANGARVISMSLGGPGTSTVLSNAVSYAQDHGVLVVAAAGNEGSTTPSYPAALPGVVAVGATDGIGHRAGFSSYGSWVTVGAPGTGIWSTVPVGGSTDFPGSTSGYASADGTSMATPVVAAEAALLLAYEPSATAAQVRSAIVGSAHGYAGLGLGAGQVDLAAALQHLPPASAPTLTAPGTGALVSGAVPLRATTSDPAASPTTQFLVDGSAAGAPVAVSGGAAGLEWQSWGVVDGTHQVSAQGCNAYGCGPASTPVSVTVQNPAPALSSPADGSTVHDVADLAVTVSDAAPAVLASVDGTPLGRPVAVSSGSAHVAWPTAGLPNGQHQVSVAACDASGRCGSSSTATLTVANAPPVITAPKAGQTVSGSFALGATATSGGLRFLLDGKQIGFDPSAPYSAVVNFSSVADGTHALAVVPCTTAGTRCEGPSATRSISVKSLHPAITKAAPSVFSPNGDKRADTTALSVTLPDTETVVWGVRDAAGSVVRGPVRLGKLAKGTHVVVWNGLRNSGTRAANGRYTAYVSTSGVVASTTLYGYATRTVRLDTVAPSVSLSGMATSVYPVRDGYRDSLTVKAATNEPGVLTMTVRDGAGKPVRTLSLSHGGTGTFALVWNGRTSAGALLPAGTYSYAVVSQDVALNRRSSARYTVGLSLKKLVPHAVAKVVTPAAGLVRAYVGACSRVQTSAVWSGGYEYLSDYYACGVYDGSDLAAAEERLTLPAAVKYSGISVSATGQEDLPGYGDTAAAFYLTPASDPYGGTTLGSSYGTRSLGAVPVSLLWGGRTLHWLAGTVDGSYYDIRSFTVRYTYYVLA